MDLKEISSEAQLVAQATSAAFNVDITILNHNLLRIAGTGHHFDAIGNCVTGVASEFAIENMIDIVIPNPGKSEYCSRCKKTVCQDTVCFISVIIDEGESFGVISLTSTLEQVRDDLLAKQSSVLEYLDQIGKLLIAKVRENEKTKELYLLADRLTAIVDSVDDGIILVDEKGVITNVNPSAEKLLFSERKNLEGHLLTEAIPLFTDEEPVPVINREIRFRLHGRNINLVYSATPVTSVQNCHGFVYLFKDAPKFRKTLYNMVSPTVTNSFEDILTVNNHLSSLKIISEKVAAGDSTMLIRGETGTGKELFARAIHQASPRRRNPFVAINCSAIPDNLLESELFGYSEGAFTGAKQGGNPGKLEMANGGSLFLDEVGDMPIYLQGKLLRVIEDRRFCRLGSAIEIRVNVRIISATNRNLEEMIKMGSFRSDLYYRLAVVPLLIPPLRERKEDIKMLLNHFLKSISLHLNKNITDFSEGAIEILTNYDWPGNAREMRNTVELMVNLSNGPLLTQEFVPVHIQTDVLNNPEITISSPPLIKVEKEMLQKAFSKYLNTKNAVDKIAEELGISKSSVYRKLKKYGLSA